MEPALEVSFYVLGVVFAVGLAMVLVLVRDVFFHGRFHAPPTTVRRVPTTALDAVRAALAERKAAQAAIGAEQADALRYEVRHLEHRLAALEDQTFADQEGYYAACKARERVWREWHTLYEQARRAGPLRRRDQRQRLEALRKQFQGLNGEAEAEYRRAVTRDELALETMLSQGVLESDVVKSAPAPAPPAGTAPSAETMPPAGTTSPGTGQAPGPGAAPRPDAAGAGPTTPPPQPSLAAPAGMSSTQPSDLTGADGPPPRRGRWRTPLTPYPPAQGGAFGQAELAQLAPVQVGRTYSDPTLSTADLPGGALSAADLRRSSLAEVRFVGVQRLLGCLLVEADLRRIELPRAETPHLIQDCDLRGASLAQALLAGALFRRCDLSGTHWRGARLDRVRFERCTLGGAHWEGVDLSRTSFCEESLATADLSSAGAPPLPPKPERGPASPSASLSTSPSLPPSPPGSPPESSQHGNAGVTAPAAGGHAELPAAEPAPDPEPPAQAEVVGEDER